jgi:hypothetical protein
MSMEKKERKKKYRKVKKGKNMRMKKWKKKKRKRKGEWQKGYERDESRESKKNKVQGRMSRCWETKLSLFFQPCAIRQRGHHRCLVVIIFFYPCTCPPF